MQNCMNWIWFDFEIDNLEWHRMRYYDNNIITINSQHNILLITFAFEFERKWHNWTIYDAIRCRRRKNALFNVSNRCLIYNNIRWWQIPPHSLRVFFCPTFQFVIATYKSFTMTKKSIKFSFYDYFIKIMSALLRWQINWNCNTFPPLWFLIEWNKSKLMLINHINNFID